MKVIRAPSRDPVLLVASATVIINTTYIQAIATKYMPHPKIKHYNMETQDHPPRATG
jgi:hypothetical protein